MICENKRFTQQANLQNFLARATQTSLTALLLLTALNTQAQTCGAIPARRGYFYSSGLNVVLPLYPRSGESSLLLLQNVVDMRMANPENCRNIQQENPYQSETFQEGAVAAGGSMECTTNGYTWTPQRWGVSLTATTFCTGAYRLSNVDGKCYPINGTVCPDPETQAGEPPTCAEGGTAVGNPIEPGFRQKFQIESLYRAANGFPLELKAYYSSARQMPTPWQGAWQYAYFQSLLYIGGNVDLGTTAKVTVYRPDGAGWLFVPNGSGGWVAAHGRSATLKQTSAPAGWVLTTPDNVVETFDDKGRLLSLTRAQGAALSLTYPSLLSRKPTTVTDDFGRTLSIGYDGDGRAAQFVDPAAGQISHVETLNAQSVLTFQDGTRKRYLFNEASNIGTDGPTWVWSRPLLTGIESELGQRFANFTYEKNGDAKSSEHIGGVYRYTVATGPSDTRIVTDPLGTVRTYAFSTQKGNVRRTSVQQPPGAGSTACAANLTYDANVNVNASTDFNGIKTCYAYDSSRNLETQRLEGLPTAAVCAAVFTNPPADTRLVTTQWHPDWRLETRRAEPRLITTWIYNGQGATCAPANALVDGKPIAVVCSKTEQATSDETGAQGFAASASGAARTWSFTYNRWGQVLSSNGPRGDASDTMTYAYYADTQANWTQGDLSQSTNALGHVTRFTRYNRHGQLLERVEPNTLITQYNYDLRQRLTRISVGDETSAYAYDAAGNLTQVTLPDGGVMTYTYDPAFRLVAIQDQQGNRIDYTLDAMGNRVTEKAADALGVLRRNVTRTMDALNRVQNVVGAE